ncbi:odorant receptor 63a-like [Teleopsis dalmanni]|uniref:odorant receptor 63a-like n=1 Tax=Teleopsis dalmanni TaxID=139649 RepID=UPI0018CFBABB|nr:odorant receptor 63a-like [Teleopsis dalmanni]
MTEEMSIQTKEEELEKRNYNRIKELIRLSFTLGVNLTKPTVFKESLKVINICLIVSSIVSIYGHWAKVMKHSGNIPMVGEAICTAFQTLISVVKMIYFLFAQRRFQILLASVQRHEILQKMELFKKDFAVNKKLKLEVDNIMNDAWKDSRRQIIYYLSACIGICSNYFFVALGFNIYHQWKGTPNYIPRFSYPVYYPGWAERGFEFPYYHIQMYLTTCALYISGMCAVTFDGVFIILCVHGVGLINSLKAIVKHSTSMSIPKEQRVEYLRYCIFHYKRIYQYVLEVNQMFKHISISQFLMSLVVLGIVLFQMSISVESDRSGLIRMIMYISAAGYQIIIFCYNGQRLLSASEDIPFAFYDCEWYNESEAFKFLVKMSIMRSQHTFQFDISWFTTMSLATLMAFVKTCSSYFLLLRNISE